MMEQCQADSALLGVVGRRRPALLRVEVLEAVHDAAVAQLQVHGRRVVGIDLVDRQHAVEIARDRNRRDEKLFNLGNERHTQQDEGSRQTRAGKPRPSASGEQPHAKEDQHSRRSARQ